MQEISFSELVQMLFPVPPAQRTFADHLNERAYYLEGVACGVPEEYEAQVLANADEAWMSAQAFS